MIHADITGTVSVLTMFPSDISIVVDARGGSPTSSSLRDLKRVCRLCVCVCVCGGVRVLLEQFNVFSQCVSCQCLYSRMHLPRRTAIVSPFSLFPLPYNTAIAPQRTPS